MDDKKELPQSSFNEHKKVCETNFGLVHQRNIDELYLYYYCYLNK